MAFDVSTYRLERTDGQPQNDETRRELVNCVFALRRENAASCRGYGFIIDVDEETVAVPARWELPTGVEVGNYYVTFAETFRATHVDREHRRILLGIMREAIKKHLKENGASHLGPVWQDYDAFCQVPDTDTQEDVLFCRRISAHAKVLAENRWVVQTLLSTASIDGRTVADYYRSGQVSSLAEMIKVKQANRLDRQNQPPAIRMWYNQSTEHQTSIGVVELQDIELILSDAAIKGEEQKNRVPQGVACCKYKQPLEHISPDCLRLILDTQITLEEHRQTIISPDERAGLMQQLRDSLADLDAFGVPLRLAPQPVDASSLRSMIIRPPALRLRGAASGDHIIPAPELVTEQSLTDRAKQRARRVRQYGFLHGRPLHPLLAWPAHLSSRGGERLKADLEYLWREQGLDVDFGYIGYEDVQQIRDAVNGGTYNVLFAALPEPRGVPDSQNDTHEKIKRVIEIPSQCIRFYNTRPREWVHLEWGAFESQVPHMARRIRNTYEICLGNLLVKHHWVPFVPAEPLAYNVQVGIDVGGRHNNRAMACLGYGFSNPDRGLLFRPDLLPVETQKVEPVPKSSLYSGLLQMFEYTASELRNVSLEPNFEKVLFLRDGRFTGEAGVWNEVEAIHDVHAELVSRGWLGNHSTWTAVEIKKYAEGWRLLRNTGTISNPLVGQCVFPFDDECMALICTTGSPYLRQGTACPLMISIDDISGRAAPREVLRDLVWSADMCYSKLDMGMRLPWVLNIADTGALECARSYRLTGISV